MSYDSLHGLYVSDRMSAISFIYRSVRDTDGVKSTMASIICILFDNRGNGERSYPTKATKIKC